MSAYLKKWRTTLGFTLEQVAAKIGRHFTTVQKWETGVNAVGMRELELLEGVMHLLRAERRF
jgi:transcriptional regulator with XRE-family HTH domain